MLSFSQRLLIFCFLCGFVSSKDQWSENSAKFELLQQRIDEIDDNLLFRSRALNLTEKPSGHQYDCELEQLENCEADFLKSATDISQLTSDTEILNLCVRLDQDAECLYQYLNKCPKIEKSSSFTILKYIIEKNRNVVETCKRTQYEWIDPHTDHNTVNEIDFGICIDSKDIEECDKKFDDFDVGKEMIESIEECHQFEAYKRCIGSVVSESKCNHKVKDIALKYLESRVRFAIDCETGVRFAEQSDMERGLIKAQMQSEVDAILDPICGPKTRSLMAVCTEQMQKRIDNTVFASYAIDDQVLPRLCCSYAEFTKCATIMTLLKCGKTEALRFAQIIEPLRQISVPFGCENIEYGSEICQSILI